MNGRMLYKRLRSQRSMICEKSISLKMLQTCHGSHQDIDQESSQRHVHFSMEEEALWATCMVTGDKNILFKSFRKCRMILAMISFAWKTFIVNYFCHVRQELKIAINVIWIQHGSKPLSETDSGVSTTTPLPSRANSGKGKTSDIL